MAFRIIVADVAQCYQALGLLHGTLPGAAAALQGLHLGAQAQRLPLAAHRRDRPASASASRSRSAPSEMQDQAERGVAAHWIYKQGGPSTDAPQYAWLRSLLDILDKAPNAEEFLEHTKLEMFQDQVFCFTPKGKLIALPRGATPIDFAYAVHSQVGDTCVGAKINGRMLPLRTQLAERRPGRDHHLEGADAVADLGTLRRHRQGPGRDPPLHPHAPARAVHPARQVAARQDLPRGRLRGHREGPRRRARQLQAGHDRRSDRRRSARASSARAKC